MRTPSDVIVVSGLPRSGTSLMMQMLDAGGIDVVTDHVRTADTDNPKGYYEFEAVKRTKEDPSWLPAARGKAVKMVSQLLYDLPPTEKYLVIFMERDMDEVLLSQEKMLRRLGREPAPRGSMAGSFAIHLDRLHGWLREQLHFRTLKVSYNALVERPEEQAPRVAEFLGRGADAARMAAAVDPALYRNRGAAGTPAGGQG